MRDRGPLYSVRMRASSSDPLTGVATHISGGERLVEADSVDSVVVLLTERALGAGAHPDDVLITVDPVPLGTVVTIPALPMTTVDAMSCIDAIAIASDILTAIGVRPDIVSEAFRVITDGPVLAGAAIVDSVAGMRLDPDHKGVRLTRLDYTTEARAALELDLRVGLLPHQRAMDALAIASKAIWAGVVGELCWSDDSRYQAGYVASRAFGYIRFPSFKPPDAAGGRVLFVDWRDDDIAVGIQNLRRVPVLIDQPITINPSLSPQSFREQL